MLAPLRGASLFYSDSIEIHYNWHSYPFGTSSSPVIFSIFNYASIPILCFHVIRLTLFCLTLFSTLSLWSIWKKKENGQDLNCWPPGCRESALSIRPRWPPPPPGSNLCKAVEKTKLLLWNSITKIPSI